jgi:hypothetical protein
MPNPSANAEVTGKWKYNLSNIVLVAQFLILFRQ